MNAPAPETAHKVTFDMDAVAAVLGETASGDVAADLDEAGAVGVWGLSVFDDIDTAFTRMSGGDDPVGVDCSCWAELGLPERFMALPELRAWMLRHRTNYPAVEAVWQHLVQRARTDRQWVTVAAGMALPGLIAAAGRLTRGLRGDTRDIDSEILLGFLTALRTVDVHDGRLYARLRWAAFRAGIVARYEHQPYVLVADIEKIAGVAPHLPYGHPDLIVARAVAADVIEPDDAELIMVTRLDATPIETLAAAAGVDGAMLRMRRKRAEVALAHAVTTGVLSGAISEEGRRRLDKQAEARKVGRAARSG